ncbi:GNAT family N-acetyltransferase [Granulibacter bethesdensis]|uniref:GNAT family N-acetyltransferase n=1 Tax=Granulibacter bethesdensis TaxID=364410 RepID=UPI0003F1F1C4|nr:GNAT family N-acetyltransferase [Granulibacter bethesdensis]AHJ67846.1 Acetyltransferase [Granulibacter bethesdensis]
MSGSEPVIRAHVTVTFLRMDRPPAVPAPALPEGMRVVRVIAPDLAFYRFLYATVGAPYLWWLRRVMPDRDLAALLSDPQIGVFVLEADGQTAGFYELDARYAPSVNLSYFGLMPGWVGRGLGHAFLRHAVDMAWATGSTRYVTVNTCNADHPRALPLYRQVGFHPYRQMVERWNIPVRLGMVIPEHLQQG